MPNIANLAPRVVWTRHHAAGLMEIAALSSDGTIVKVADATIYPRTLEAGWSFGGGETDPVGPQRWPLKL